MRDRSGRSGRRRGSQNPGTAAPRGSVTPSCAAGGRAAAKPGSSDQASIAMSDKRGEQRGGRAVKTKNCIVRSTRRIWLCARSLVRLPGPGRLAGKRGKVEADDVDGL